MTGAGKYDDVATLVRLRTGGSVLLIVINGELGSGFAAQVVDPRLVGSIPAVLRRVADQIEADAKKLSH